MIISIFKCSKVHEQSCESIVIWGGDIDVGLELGQMEPSSSFKDNFDMFHVSYPALPYPTDTPEFASTPSDDVTSPSIRNLILEYLWVRELKAYVGNDQNERKYATT